MSAEKHTEWLVDLLYPEEIEDSAGASETAELTPEEQLEFAQMREFLAEVRRALPDVSPSEHVRAHILGEAARHAAMADSPAPVSGRRVASAPPSSPSIWARTRRQGVLQLAAALCLLVGAAAVLTSTFDTGVEHKFRAANDGVQQNVAFEPAPQAPDLKREVDESPVVESRLPVELAEAQEEEAPGDKMVLAQRETREGEPPEREVRRSVRRSRSKARPASPSRTPSPKKYAYEPEAKKESAKKSGSLDDSLLDNIEEPSKAASADSSVSLFGGDEGAASKPKAVSEDSRRAEKSEMQQAPGAATSSVDDLEADKDRAPSSTIPQVEQSFRSERYQSVISQADSYLSAGLGTPAERAKVLEYKARALDALGRSAEAKATYQELEREHADYYKRNQIRKKARSRRAPSKKSSADSFEKSDLLKSY